MPNAQCTKMSTWQTKYKETCATKWIRGLPYSRGVKNFNIESLKKRSFYACLFTEVHPTLKLSTSCSLFIGLRMLGRHLEHMEHLRQTPKQNFKLPHRSCVALHLKFVGHKTKGFWTFFGLLWKKKLYLIPLATLSLTIRMVTSHLVKLLKLQMKVCQIQTSNSQKLQAIV